MSITFFCFIDMKKVIKIRTSKLKGNSGQLEGLPENPRLWDATDVEILAESLNDSPLLAEARPLLVYPHEDKYIVLGGNLRLEAYKKNGAKEIPCYVMDNVPFERLREIVMKDNSSFGEWDADELANKWSDLPLSSWGVDVAGLDAGSEYSGSNKEMNPDDWSEDMTLKLHFTHEQMAWVVKRFEGKDAKKELLTALGYYEQD